MNPVFQSTLSMRRATRHPDRLDGQQVIFQSTLSMRRATRTFTRMTRRILPISIHALHEESDAWGDTDNTNAVHISIHALHEESDALSHDSCLLHCLFQSTLSMRRATTSTPIIPLLKLFQSTLSMRRATAIANAPPLFTTISIHALHEESDTAEAPLVMPNMLFQSTLSMRRATVHDAATKSFQSISIHALHEESDTACRVYHHRLMDFNPRSP